MHLTQPPVAFGETFRQFQVALDGSSEIEWHRVGVGSGKLKALARASHQEDLFVGRQNDSPPISRTFGTNEAMPRFGGAPRPAGLDVKGTSDFLNKNVTKSQFEARKLWQSIVGNRPSEKLLSSALNGINEALLCFLELIQTDPTHAAEHQEQLVENILPVLKDVLQQIYQFDVANLPAEIRVLLAELNARLGQLTNHRKITNSTKYALVMFIHSLVAPILLKTDKHVVGIQRAKSESWLKAHYERIYEINSTALSALLVTEQLKDSDLDRNMALVSMIAAVRQHMQSILKAVAHAQHPESQLSETPYIKDVIHVAVVNAVLFSMNTSLDALNSKLEGLPAAGRGAKRNIVQGILDAVTDMEDVMDDVSVALSSLGIESPYGMTER